jgi:hypothetical protein
MNASKRWRILSQIIVFRSDLPHLAWLRMNTPIKLDRQPMFKTVVIDYPAFNAALAAKLCA